MKKLKAVAIFIFVFGVLCLLMCVLMMSSLEQMTLTWGQLQTAGEQLDVSSIRAGIIYHSIWYAVIGLLSIVSAIGLFLRKEWARKLWLASLILLAGISLYWFVDEYRRDILLRPENMIGYPLIALIILAMWFYLTRQKTKGLFATRDS